MRSGGGALAWWRGPGVVVDALVAAGLCVTVVHWLWQWRPGGGFDLAGPVVAMVVTFGALAARRVWPLPVAVLVSAGVVACVATDIVRMPFVLAHGISVYSVARHRGRAAGMTAAGVGSAAVAVAYTWWDGQPLLDPIGTGWVVWLLLALAVGEAARVRRDYVVEVEGRARRAEESREQEARRRVVEERLRIARELHDVVAHHIAVVNVQAGVATHLIGHNPGAAEEALGHVRRSGRAVMVELNALLNVLRQSGEPVAPTRPTPGVAQLEGLARSFAAAGLQVEWEVGGHARPAPLGVELVAYRLVQESLTNAHKHGRGSGAQVVLDYTDDSLRIRVRNDREREMGEGGAPGSGLGLVGMRERVAAVGGTLSAGPTREGFVVEAVLPITER
ncbi:sensor histidine kinase [Nocardiopsis ansamitocini]|uniref:histidine kinase n=1 Tax=Nocardiopsis ansamitocini TaxID=1670832 RepID=A0A9W6P689_9ACTN|nr:histidine kinase [Nocardiopsis ansamitocini]GLU48205.1 two-component sensor histidine kinase [Nocardiopsis ansamitocini]